jgi:branched-subunit amino acid aminotransferase/4-amino-4-deoxychorismate lyase
MRAPARQGKACAGRAVMVNKRERRAKDRNVSADLVETMRFDPETGIADLEQHLARLKAAAEARGFGFDRHGARNELQAATFRLGGPRLLRLALSPSGAIAIETRALPKRLGSD